MTKRKRTNIWKVIGVYTSGIIGAGFASGQELLQFFAHYGVFGIAGLAAAGLLFAFAGWAVLDICFTEHITDVTDLLKRVMGEELGIVVEVAAVFFMCVLYATMMAATGASLKQYANVPFTAGVVIGSALAFTALLFDLKGVVAVCARIAPYLVAGGVMVGVLTFISQYRPAFAGNNNLQWLYAAITYAGYNIVSSVSVLASMSVMLNNRKEAMKSGVISGLAVTFLGLCMIYPLYLNYANIRYTEIPLLSISRQYGSIFEFLYMLLLFGAIFTTALSNGFAIIQWLNKRLNIKPIIAKLILAFGGLLFAHIGFSVFVAKVYPVFCIVGLMEIAAVLAAWAKKKHGKT